MSRSPNRWIAPLLWTLSVAGVVAAGLWVRDVMRARPLATFEGRPTDDRSLALEQTEYTYFNEKGQLVTQAKVDQMFVSKDRVTVELIGVRDGRYILDPKTTLTYSMQRAIYNPPIERLTGQGNIRVKSKQFDLRTDVAQFDGRAGVLQINRPVRGLLNGGTISARSLVFNVRQETGRVMKVTWQGQVSTPETGQTQRRWTISSDIMDARGRLMIYTRGRATDGEVIVMADRIEHNRDTDVLTATGNVRYFGTDANATAGRAVIFRRERRAQFSNRVTMLLKPSDTAAPVEEEIPALAPVVPDEIARTLPSAPTATPPDAVRDSGTLRSYPISIVAGEIEYFYARGSRRARITGSPQARQQISPTEWRMAWAPLAEYDGEQETMTLRSVGSGRSVRLLNSAGDDLTALTATISTRRGDDRLNAQQISGTITTDDEEVPGTGGGTGGSTGGGTAPPSISGPIGGPPRT